MNAVNPDRLSRAFTDLHGQPPSLIVRAPGRVNLIGEHTDYSLLPVLPLAISLGTYVAAAPLDEPRVLGSSLQFEGAADLDRADLDALPGAAWHCYLFGALKMLQGRAPERGARLLISGDLPTTGGLSSSSSFTMAVLLCLNELWELGLSREAMVELAIVAERHVGVESGGMDQTVIGLAQAGAALRIDFDPPVRRPVALPGELRLVVAYSGEEAPKGGTAMDAYNERVIACRLAAVLLGHAVGVDPGAPPVLGRLLDASSVEAVEALPGRACAAEVSREVGAPYQPWVRFTAGAFSGQQQVGVRSAARHVLSEARRVDQAEAAVTAGDLPALGRLLDASQESLARQYRCSSVALDRLCLAMKEGGALGARLTGAGFGGYAIAAATPDSVEQVMTAAQKISPGPVFQVTPVAGMERIR